MKTRVLIVDDEETIARTLQLIMETRGYKARTAFSGEQAVQLAAEFTPDILLTDYSMPGMNGLELATKLARQLPGCRMFMLTAYTDTTRFKRQPRQPEIKMLSKPIPPAELLTAIAEPEVSTSAKIPKILNVDDIPAHRYSITRLLCRRGFDVDEAACGEEALAKLKDGKYDAVLLDINLPDINGFEVCRRMREQLGVETPVLHFTATYHDEKAPTISKSVGANGYTEQPVESDVLIAQLRELIQQKLLSDGVGTHGQ